MSDRVKTVENPCHLPLFVASLQETPGAALPEKWLPDQSRQWQPFPRLREKRQAGLVPSQQLLSPPAEGPGEQNAN